MDVVCIYSYGYSQGRSKLALKLAQLLPYAYLADANYISPYLSNLGYAKLWDADYNETDEYNVVYSISQNIDALVMWAEDNLMPAYYLIVDTGPYNVFALPCDIYVFTARYIVPAVHKDFEKYADYRVYTDEKIQGYMPAEKLAAALRRRPNAVEKKALRHGLLPHNQHDAKIVAKLTDHDLAEIARLPPAPVGNYKQDFYQSPRRSALLSKIR